MSQVDLAHPHINVVINIVLWQLGLNNPYPDVTDKVPSYLTMTLIA